VPEQIIIHDKYFTHVKTVPVPRTVPVPIPPPARQAGLELGQALAAKH